MWPDHITLAVCKRCDDYVSQSTMKFTWYDECFKNILCECCRDKEEEENAWEYLEEYTAADVFRLIKETR